MKKCSWSVYSQHQHRTPQLANMPCQYLKRCSAPLASACVGDSTDIVPVWAQQESETTVPRDFEWHGRRDDCRDQQISGFRNVARIHHRESLLHRGFQERWAPETPPSLLQRVLVPLASISVRGTAAVRWSNFVRHGPVRADLWIRLPTAIMYSTGFHRGKHEDAIHRKGRRQSKVCGY